MRAPAFQYGYFDTRVVFHTYSIAVGISGFYLWILSSAGLTRDAFAAVFGAVPDSSIANTLCGAMLLVAIGAWGMGNVRDSRARGTLLGFMAWGHMAMMILAGSDFRGRTPWVVFPLTTAWWVFWYFEQNGDGRVRGETPSGSTAVAVSGDGDQQFPGSYEQEVRLAAGIEERHRLARDLHDSVKQQLFVIQTTAATVQSRFDEDPSGAKAALQTLRAAGRDALVEMNAMLDQLRADAVENVGLVGALRQHCEALGLRTGAVVTCHCGDLPHESALPRGAHRAILYVAKEALANIGRHARAKNVDVTLTTTKDAVVLMVRDDGVGIQWPKPGAGLGLSHMRERALEVGGACAIEKGPGGGTVVECSVPHSGSIDLAPEVKAIRWSAAVTLVCPAVALIEWLSTRQVGRFSSSLAIFLPMGGVFLLHSAVSYTRARRLQALATWTSSPSPS